MNVRHAAGVFMISSPIERAAHGGHELDVREQPLGAGAEHDDRGLERQSGLELGDRQPVRLDAGPALQDLLAAHDHVAGEPAIGDA